MLNPINRTVYIPKELVGTEQLESGYSALAEYSMLNTPNVRCYAAERISQWKDVMTNSLQNSQVQVAVEMWRGKKVEYGWEVESMQYDIENYKRRPRTVAFYGRVSTEHEQQLSALSNQMDWYIKLAQNNPNWHVVARYIDEGITGTQMKKRPSFMQMLEHAKQGRFDLIVTRELSRFARNTVDALNATRELKQYGVEVYFVNDGIWTMDGDGEVRLTIMASIAQDESRKTSERVKAGQKISREKGVLYGNGNILGYDRIGKSYVINEEQAATVRRIYELYAGGMGEQGVAETLMAEGRKDGGGGCTWTASKVSRVLRKPTYKGYITYNRSHTENFLDHKRVNHAEKDYTLVKGDFEPIVSEELWNTCNELRTKRAACLMDSSGRKHAYGKSFPQNKWTKILYCDCGAPMRCEGIDKKANGILNIKAKLKGLPPAIHRQQALSAA